MMAIIFIFFQTDLIKYLFIIVTLGVCLFAAPEPDPEEETDSLLDADQWVLNIPQGHEHAKRLAEEQQLNFLGEVLPKSNLFHFTVKYEKLARSFIYKKLNFIIILGIIHEEKDQLMMTAFTKFL